MASEASTTEAATYPRGFSRGTDWKWPMVPARKLVTLNYARALKADTRSPGKVPVFGTNGQCGWHDAPLTKAPGLILGRKGQGPLGVEWCDKDFWVIDTAYYASTLTPDIDLKYLYHLVKYVGLNHLKDGTSNPTLEAMARALFQSWFVDFDPVRLRLSYGGQIRATKDNPAGLPAEALAKAGLDPATAALFPAHFDHKAECVVPTGWRATTLGEVIEIFDSKRIPLSGREREARKGRYPYHGAASVMDYVDDYLFDGIYALMGEDGSVINDDGTPVLQYVWGKFWANNHAHVLRGKNGISTEHLLLHLKGCNIAPFVNGAVQPKLNQGNMNRIPFMLPPPEIGQAFAKTIEPLFAQIRANTEQSRTLATLRDTLLPKLLSGEVSITNFPNPSPR